jgi:hypothetical protein
MYQPQSSKDQTRFLGDHLLREKPLKMMMTLGWTKSH